MDTLPGTRGSLSGVTVEPADRKPFSVSPLFTVQLEMGKDRSDGGVEGLFHK